MEKQQIEVFSRYIFVDCGTISYEELQTIKPGEYIQINTEDGYIMSDASVFTTRLETDEEFLARKNKIANYNKLNEQIEKQEYERLKKKYETKT